MVKDIQTFQRDWPLAVVTKVFPGSDGVIRVADLISGTQTFRRPVIKLVKLRSGILPDSAPGENVQVAGYPSTDAPSTLQRHPSESEEELEVTDID